MKTKTPWGPIGYITLKRTYSRRLKENDPNSATEEFEDIVERVIKACDKQLKVGFTDKEEKELRAIFLGLKGIVAGRFLWQLGTKTVEKLGLLSLQNCAFTVVNEPIRPFTWAFDALMLGSGVGYNIQKEYVYELPKVKKVKITRLDTNDAEFIVPDSREGWVELLRRVMEAHFVTGKGFSYSTVCVRGKGTLIRGFGGTASGPEDLCEGMADISKVLNNRASKKVRPIDCLDVMNIIGRIVVAGNVRRSAQIAIGDMDDLQYLNAKRWDLGGIPNWRAMSNNSVVCNDFNLLPDQIWEGYLGNGEPYGLINLALARAIGRTGDTKYPDPDVCGFNPCFAGDMLLKTSDGFKTFSSLKNKTPHLVNHLGEIVPGRVWSNGVKDIVNVKLSSGELIKCTPDHRFMLIDGSECRAENLKGEKISPFSETNIENDDFAKLGFLQGDGCLTRLNSESHLGLEINIGEKDRDIAKMFGLQYKEGKRLYYVTEYNNVLIDLRFKSKPLPERSLPETFDSWKIEHKKSFMRGLYSANGCIIKNVRVSFKTTCLELAQQMKEFLGQINIVSYITTNKAKNVTFENGTFLCKESYDLNIASFGSIVKFSKQIGFVHGYKNEALKETIRLNSPTVISVTKGAEPEEVFDFELKDSTHWGVVAQIDGSQGYIAHNCAEQSLAPYETCCLAETYLPNIVSFEELCKVLKYLYRINKHSLALPCHMPETEAVVHKHMRMGIGITGYLQATEEQKGWLKDAYVVLRAFDDEYSEKHGFPKSIKLTTVKPSGTLSLLAGVTSGAHPAYSQYYIRRVRMASSISLVSVCRQKGYPVEFQRNFDGSEDMGTVVVSFPCKFPNGTLLAKDMTAVDQLEVVKRLQTEWSDNAVSVTIYYQKAELPAIKTWLKKNYNTGLKTVSFLLHNEHGFVQAPLEEITEEQYLEMVSKCQPIDAIESVEEGAVTGVDECQNGVCPIK